MRFWGGGSRLPRGARLPSVICSRSNHHQSRSCLASPVKSWVGYTPLTAEDVETDAGGGGCRPLRP